MRINAALNRASCQHIVLTTTFFVTVCSFVITVREVLFTITDRILRGLFSGFCGSVIRTEDCIDRFLLATQLCSEYSRQWLGLPTFLVRLCSPLGFCSTRSGPRACNKDDLTIVHRPNLVTQRPQRTSPTKLVHDVQQVLLGCPRQCSSVATNVKPRK